MDAAVKKGLTVSAKPNKNFLYIGELLEQYKLERLFPKSQFAVKDAVTFKDLLTRSVSIHKTCSFLQQEIDVIKKGNRKISEEERAFLNSLITLRDCFQLVKAAINKKKLKSTAEEPLFLCALCWKRVRVSDKEKDKDVDARRKDSTFYCPDHLPNKSKHLYRRDKTALISAMKTTNNRFLSELNDHEQLAFKTSHPLPPTFYKWLSSFSPKPSKLFLLLQTNGKRYRDWQSKANCLSNFSLALYPAAYEKIKEVDAHDFNSIELWLIDGVVNALDDSKVNSEVKFWKKEEATRSKLSLFFAAPNIENREVFEIEHVNEYLMLMCTVLSRYDGYKIVERTPQPRGGGNEKNESLRARIKLMRDQNVKTTGKQNVKSIAKVIGRSPTRVYAILKELNNSD
jgi:hypothetical protein